MKASNESICSYKTKNEINNAIVNNYIINLDKEYLKGTSKKAEVFNFFTTNKTKMARAYKNKVVAITL